MDDENSKISRPIKTPEELRDFYDAIYYEIKMLNDVADEIPNYLKGVIHDALVESFVIHARVLIDFLYGYPNPDPKKHDIIAREFLVSSNNWSSKLPGDLKEVKERADKLAAHLTCDRVIKYRYDKGWQITQIRNSLNVIFDDWFKKVPPDRIGEKLKDYKAPSANVIEKLAAIGGVGPNYNGDVIANRTNGATASTGTAYTAGVAVTRKLIK